MPLVFQTSALFIQQKKLVKCAFLFHSPHFLSLYINPLRWRANQFPLCAKRPGLRLQPSARANITLCLLAPPTPPPHICLHLESFCSSRSGVVLKLLQRRTTRSNKNKKLQHWRHRFHCFLQNGIISLFLSMAEWKRRQR